jgi:hypothetical protein
LRPRARCKICINVPRAELQSPSTTNHGACEYPFLFRKAPLQNGKARNVAEAHLFPSRGRQ